MGETLTTNFITLRHNRLYIPPNVQALVFDYLVDEPSNNDTLDVYIGGEKIDSLPITTKGDYRAYRIPLDPGTYGGTVDTITFELNPVDFWLGSDLFLDNIHFTHGPVLTYPRSHPQLAVRTTRLSYRFITMMQTGMSRPPHRSTSRAALAGSRSR